MITSHGTRATSWECPVSQRCGTEGW